MSKILTMSDLNYYQNLSVSNSKLSWLNPHEGGSPAKYKMMESAKEEETETVSLKKGKLLHLAILEPDLYDVIDFEPPSPAIQNIVRNFYEIVKEKDDPEKSFLSDDVVLANIIDQEGYGADNWKEETKLKKVRNAGLTYLNFLHSSSDKLVVKGSVMETVHKCEEVLRSDEKVADYLFGMDMPDHEIINELVVYFPLTVDVLGEDYKVKVDAKARLDRVIIKLDENGVPTNALIVDLKTTGSSISQFGRSVITYHYYRQMAMYQLALNHYIQTQYNVNVPVEVVIIPVTTSEPFETGVFLIPESILEIGVKELFMLLSRYAWHKEKDQWLHPFEYVVRGFYTMPNVPMEDYQKSTYL